MKRFLSVLLALALALSLAACGGGDSAPAADSAAPAADAAEPETEPEPAPEPTPEPTPEPPKPQDIALDGEQVLMDQDGVKVTATDLQYGQMMMDGEAIDDYYELTVKVENHSGQQLIGTDIYTWSAVVDGKMTFVVRPAPDDSDGTMPQMLLADGAEEEWALRFYASNYDNMTTELPVLQQFVILPSFSLVGQDGFSADLYAAAEPTEVRTNATDPNAEFDLMPAELAVDDENVSVALNYFFHENSSYLVEMGYEEYMIQLLCRNNSDQPLYLKGSVQTANGQEVTVTDILTYNFALPGMVCEVSVPVMSTDLQAVGIDSYEDITDLVFTVSGYESEEALHAENARFTTAPITLDAAFIADNYVSAAEMYGE